MRFSLYNSRRDYNCQCILDNSNTIPLEGSKLDLQKTMTGDSTTIMSPHIDQCQRLNSTVYALDFSAWKKPIVRTFFQNSSVHFIKDASKLITGDILCVWGSKPIEGNLADGVSIIRLEDGFLRSVGLGADLVSPVSWVADSRGIYYDSRSESDLEHYLASHDFDDELVARASKLREQIIELGLTKYNVGFGSWRRPLADRVILVPGQVEDDASIRFGAPGVCTNIDLLKAVRNANPEAYIVYKPHPDVLAGLRQKDSCDGVGENFCDEVVTDAPMRSLLKSVNEVHLMTSLTGFEALLRGLKVTCYGQPFYSGWGLTNDILPVERRTRKLTLDELVAATLILYPTYISQFTRRYISPECALLELQELRNKSNNSELGIWLWAKRFLLRVGAKIKHRTNFLF